MRTTYRVLAYLVALGVVVQAAAIAFAWFDVINAVDDGTVIDNDYDGNAGHALHGMVGMMAIPILSLLLLIGSFFAKVPGGVKWAAYVFAAVVVQIFLAFTAFGLPAVGALHGINALVILGLALTAAQRASAVVAPSEAASVTQPQSPAGSGV